MSAMGGSLDVSYGWFTRCQLWVVHYMSAMGGSLDVSFGCFN